MGAPGSLAVFIPAFLGPNIGETHPPSARFQRVRTTRIVNPLFEVNGKEFHKIRSRARFFRLDLVGSYSFPDEASKLQFDLFESTSE